jgi:hypothetical protein
LSAAYLGRFAPEDINIKKRIMADDCPEQAAIAFFNSEWSELLLPGL